MGILKVVQGLISEAVSEYARLVMFRVCLCPKMLHGIVFFRGLNGLAWVWSED